jgi:IS5 family transposase
VSKFVGPLQHGIKEIQVFISGQKRGVTNSIKKLLKRRSTIEPEIGHMKNDGRLNRNHLKGKMGDMKNVISCVSGWTSFKKNS